MEKNIQDNNVPIPDIRQAIWRKIKEVSNTMFNTSVADLDPLDLMKRHGRIPMDFHGGRP
jgi:hypothetical protein